MIDRQARNQVVEAINAYMNEEIGAFDFDDRLAKIVFVFETKDEVVRDSVDILSCCYDDLSDHKMVASKEVWNLFHRILLLLKSHADLEKKYQTIWSMTQIIAFLTLFLLVLLTFFVFRMQSAAPFFVGYGIAGIISWLISCYRQKRINCVENMDRQQLESYPFQSWLEIFQAAKSVPGFHKKKLTKEIANRKIRTGFYALMDINITIPNILMYPLAAIGWIIVSLLILLFQLFPIKTCQRRMVFLDGD